MDKYRKITELVYEIALSECSDKELIKISNERHLSLSLDEMQRIKEYFAMEKRNPTDIELESLAQSWSEHCSYKTSKPVLRETVFKVRSNSAISAIAEDAAVIDFDNEHAYVFKIESHNHPSAIEPYGGAATGVGGILRDIMCMGAQPIAIFDPLFFGPLDYPEKKLPEGVKHPLYLFRGVVKGIADYGNCVGIPTIGGMVYFDDSFVGNCLVNVACVGFMPKKHLTHSFVSGAGDVLILAGGSTGRDGIHGVTFASAELKEKSEETSRPAVQLGDPLTKEQIIHACLECVEKNLLTGLKDLGGGGLSCVVGEMCFAGGCGAKVELEKVFLKEEGMALWEIWVSESQERMMLSVKPENVSKVLEVFDFWDVRAEVIGKSTPTKRLEIFYKNRKIYDLDLKFVIEAKEYARVASATVKSPEAEIEVPAPKNLNDIFLKILSSQNIASKEWVIRNYDSKVRGNTVLYGLTGLFETPGPSDASILKPLPESFRGIAFTTDVNPRFCKLDPYWGSASAVEESFRNLVAVGAKPHTMVDCLNFGNPEKKESMAELKSSCEGLYFAAKEFNVPFVSGNVSLYNESHAGAIFPTPTILTAGIIEDVRKTVTLDVKGAGSSLYIIGETFDELGGSEYMKVIHSKNGAVVPRVYPEKTKAKIDALLTANSQELIASCHDLSEGGLVVALAEMLFSGSFGAKISVEALPGTSKRPDYKLFSESNGRWLAEVTKENSEKFEKILKENKVAFAKLGETTKEKKLIVDNLINLSLDKLYKTWREPIYKIAGGEY